MDTEQAIELSPQGSGLIIVDMQAEGCERHGPGLKPVIQNIRALLDRFRQPTRCCQVCHIMADSECQARNNVAM